MVRRFSKRRFKHALNSIHKLYKIINANYKIIDSNVMEWTNVTKIHTPPSAKRYFPPPPPDENALYQDYFATANGELSKDIADIAVSGPYVGKPTNISLEAAARPTQDRCTVKHATWSNSCRISELYVMRVFSFYFSQLIAEVRPDEHCISAFRWQFLAANSRTSSE